MTAGLSRRLLLICVALATMVAVMPARQALAHASLLSAVPADGLTIFEPPETFRLDFNEPVAPLVMRLVRPDGAVVALPIASAKNNFVVIAAPPMPQQGSYVLSWRVISADGHPVGGVVGFAIGHPSAGVDAPSAEGVAVVHAALWAAQLVLSIGLFVGVGGAVFAAWVAARAVATGRGLLTVIMLGGAIAAVISLPLQGLDALAQPLEGVWRQSAWAAGLATSWGTSVVLALATFAAGLLAHWLDNEFVARVLALLAISGIGLVFAASGHADTVDASLSAPSIFLHSVCVALWVGSLLPLTLAVRAGDRVALERFSRLIPVPLLILIASGIVLAIVAFDRLDAFWTTDYGQVLAAKLTVVTVMLVLAALNRYVLVPRLPMMGERRLVAVIAVEFALALLILGIVGLWRFTPPPRALAATETTYIHFHGEPAMAQIDLTPVRDRGATVNIAVTDDDSRPVAAKEVVLVLWNPAAGIEPIRRNATFLGGENWRVGGLRIPIAGVWRMRVEILVSDFDKILLEDNVELPRAP